MITLDVSASPFMNVPIVDADAWMGENIGEVLSDELSNTIGVGWRLYMVEDKLAHNFGRWYMEFENEKHASWFLLKWS